MNKTVEHIHWPDAPDIWMPYAPAIKVTGGTQVHLAGVTAAPVYHHHPHRPEEFDLMPTDIGGQTEAALLSLLHQAPSRAVPQAALLLRSLVWRSAAARA